MTVKQYLQGLINKDTTNVLRNTITGLDFETNEYAFKLVLEYLDENGKTIKVESETLEYKHEHVHNFVEGSCECGEKDPNYVPPHEHNFVEGSCECGEKDPNYVAKDPEPAKKKCGKKSAELLIAAISLVSVIGIFFRKRK